MKVASVTHRFWICLELEDDSGRSDEDIAQEVALRFPDIETATVYCTLEGFDEDRAEGVGGFEPV